MTAQDILTRASRALEAAAERARARDAEIVRQRTAALSALPGSPRIVESAVKPVLTFDEIERQIADKLATAERDAETKTRAAEDDALGRWQTADADAYLKYTRALEDARSAYMTLLETLQGAVHTVSAAEQARFVRDRAIAAAEGEYRSAKTIDYDAFVRASASARDLGIETIERARLDAADARRTLEAARNADATAAAKLTRGTDDAVAAAIAEAFDDQLARSRADAAREAADIIAQMRSELASVGQLV